jgi:DNA-binding response OmpR family regulator
MRMEADIFRMRCGTVWDKVIFSMVRESKRSIAVGSQNKSIKRILVVDDEYDISLTIKIVLEENGFKVDSFTNASEALENVRTGLYDLVILDVKMPEMDGFILYEKIKKLDGKVIICFLTAAGDAYYKILKKRYPTINEDYIIHKPVDNESLIRRIKSV